MQEGVLLVLTHKELAEMKPPAFLFGEGYGFQSFQPMLVGQHRLPRPADCPRGGRDARGGDRGGLAGQSDL